MTKGIHYCLRMEIQTHKQEMGKPLQERENEKERERIYTEKIIRQHKKKTKLPGTTSI